jgi:hypothetical protein
MHRKPNESCTAGQINITVCHMMKGYWGFIRVLENVKLVRPQGWSDTWKLSCDKLQLLNTICADVVVSRQGPRHSAEFRKS